jgi:hypothetical protein
VSVATEPILLRPRLLDLERVQQVCGNIGRDLALRTMHDVGVVRLGRRIFVRPEDLDRYLERLREEITS